jgi:hypothetical protein
MMAGAYARRNQRHLAAEIGRQPTSGELYIAHFLGAQDAVRLILVRDTQQHLSAPDLFPRAASANRAIFYRDGKARSVGEVYDILIARQDRVRRAAPAEVASTGGTVVGNWEATMPTIYARSEIYSLFGSFPFPANRRSREATPATETATIGNGGEAGLSTGWEAEIGDPAMQPVKTRKVKTAPLLAKPIKVKMATTNAIAGLRGSVGAWPDGAAGVDGEAAPAPRLKTIRVSSN